MTHFRASGHTVHQQTGAHRLFAALLSYLQRVGDFDVHGDQLASDAGS